MEFGELEELKIKARVMEKLKKRDEINPYSIQAAISQQTDGAVLIHVEFKIKNEDVSYQLNLSMDGAEVTILD